MRDSFFLSLRTNRGLERVNDRHFWNPGVFSYAMIPRCRPNSRVFFFFIVTSTVYMDVTGWVNYEDERYWDCWACSVTFPFLHFQENSSLMEDVLVNLCKSLMNRQWVTNPCDSGSGSCAAANSQRKSLLHIAAALGYTRCVQMIISTSFSVFQFLYLLVPRTASLGSWLLFSGWLVHCFTGQLNARLGY